jgi:hypothetical protein
MSRDDGETEAFVVIPCDSALMARQVAACLKQERWGCTAIVRPTFVAVVRDYLRLCFHAGRRP